MPRKLLSKREKTRRARLAQRRAYLSRTYGISLEEFEAQLAFQGGRCAICGGGTSKRWLAVDHNHKNGRLRGLLCWRCNGGLAKFMDKPENLARATEYLKKDGVWIRENK